MDRDDSFGHDFRLADRGRARIAGPVTIPLGLTERPPTVSVVTGSWRMSTAQTFIVTFVVASFVTEPESS